MGNGVAKSATQSMAGVVDTASARYPFLVLAMLLVAGSSVYSVYRSTTTYNGFDDMVDREELKDALDPIRTSIDRLTIRVDALIDSR